MIGRPTDHERAWYPFEPIPPQKSHVVSNKQHLRIHESDRVRDILKVAKKHSVKYRSKPEGEYATVVYSMEDHHEYGMDEYGVPVTEEAIIRRLKVTGKALTETWGKRGFKFYVRYPNIYVRYVGNSVKL